jgi:WD40 repeat protein/tRNA A-37 threonylcarbamoyl transferase component Bud32
MRSRQECSQCGLTLPPDAPDSVCPACELRGALQPDPDLAPNDPVSVTGQWIQAGVSSADDRPGLGREAPPSIPFGDYELIEEIARGGMGVVYKARQKRLNRIVAVKMVLSAQFGGKNFVQRFRAEASAAAILQHPNIVGIHDVGVQQGQHFFSMEYVEGPNLAHLVGARPLQPRRAAHYLKTIAEAIDYAHEQGILHRDLKPSNILIDSATDQPRVSDFGLAKRLDGESSLTMTGQVLGSPNFMPPEQASGQRGKGGRQSDVYGLGAILYYMLTARAPFQADSLEMLVTQVMNSDPVSPRLLNAAIPSDLQTICLKCLEKEPSRRFQTAQELAAELGRFLHDEPIHARPASLVEKGWRWCRRKPALAVAALLLVIVAIGSPIAAFQIAGEKKRAEAGEFAARRNAYGADMNLAQIATERNNLARARELLNRYEPAVQIAASASGGAVSPPSLSAERLKGTWPTDLRGWEWRYLRGLLKSDELETLKYKSENSKWILVVAFSPDGSLLAAASQDGKVTLWNAHDKQRLGELMHGDLVRSIAFSPSQPILATLAQDQFLRIWDLTTRSNIWRVPVSYTKNGPTTAAIAFSPDGTLLAIGATAGLVAVSNLVSKTQFELDTGEKDITEVAFSPDKKTLASRNRLGLLRLWNLASRRVEHVLPHGGWGESSIAFSPDGTKIASTGVDRVLNLWDTASGRLLQTATNILGFPTSASFSRDGKTIAIANSEHTITLRDVESWRTTGELKGHLAPVSTVAFSPRDDLLVSGSDDGEVKLWSTAIKEKPSEGFPLHPLAGRAFSPDFRTFVLRGTNGLVEIWDIESMKQTATFALEDHELSAVAISTGGKRLASGTSEGSVKLWAVAGDASREQNRFAMGAPILNIVFSADATEYGACDGNTIALAKVDHGTPLRTFKHPGAQKLTFSTNGLLLASGSLDGTVKFWDLPDRQKDRPPLRAHRDVVVDLAFSADGTKLATASWDRTVVIWNVGTLERISTLQGQFGEPSVVAIAPDQSRVAVATTDGTVTLWIPDRSQPIPVATFRSHSPYLNGIGFLPDGNSLVLTSLQELRVYRAPSFAEIAAKEKIESSRSRANPAFPSRF